MVIPQLDEAQTELLDIEVEKMPVKELFKPVPLVARLLKDGVADVKELANQQKDEIIKQAREA